MAKQQREIWFQRAMVGGWWPIHWKGYVLLSSTVLGALGSAGVAVYVPESRGPPFLAALLVGLAVSTGAYGWIKSLLHSQAWSKRRR
jgi:hypothetical protein